ncbi:hypothetical protein KVV02_008842 [Mortierella alpina]|uniref:Uncharacterized protein n=1 Tax=Mortierella alpina TaxID=64518 RepID=A0A9P8A706_MORAP|nr:hypothetical protein KVV02_008842 [Mortierella alpina]
MILLETDTKNEPVDRAWVRKKAFRGSNLEGAECDVVLRTGMKSLVPLSTVEDDVEHMNLDEIRRGRDETRTIVCAGTDYGVCKTSETVPLTQTRLKEHLQMFKNRSVSVDLDPSSQPPAQCSHLPKSNKITAQQVNGVSHSRKMGKRREAQLKSNDEVKTAYERISRKENSLTTAVTLTEVNAAHAVLKEARKFTQPFEAAEERQKDLHTQRLRSERAWTKLGAAERRHVLEAVREEEIGENHGEQWDL